MYYNGSEEPHENRLPCPMRVEAKAHRDGAFTAPCTCASCWCDRCGTAERREWRARRPRGHPRWSWPSTRGTCRHQSSCESPHPARIVVSNCVFELAGAQMQHLITYLLRRDGLLASLPQLLNGLLVETQILLATNEDDGKALAEVKNLGNPL